LIEAKEAPVENLTTEQQQVSKLDISRLSEIEKYQLLSQLKQELKPNIIQAEDVKESNQQIDSDYVDVEIDYTGKD
jgi:hypothetical protein